MQTLARIVGVVLLVAACGSKSKPADPTPGPGTGSAPAPTEAKCEGEPPTPDHQCIQDCGPPVAQAGDPPPKWSWLSPDDAKNRAQFGCPRCLPPETPIATPDGDRAISELVVGARMYTVDADGNRTEARVLYAGSTPITGGHRMVRVTLADGRIVAGSAGHPDAAGRTLGTLRAGDAFDGSSIARIEVVPFSGTRTWDILPSGSTGLYIANGVVLRSSFAK